MSDKRELQCPHCNVEIYIEEVNCAIFRCGIIKLTGQQIPPHASKEDCEKLDVWGCAKPFQLIEGKLVKCDYI